MLSKHGMLDQLNLLDIHRSWNNLIDKMENYIELLL